MSGDTHLVKMANDIGNFFRSEPVHKDAVAGIANHIAKFWTPRMRQEIEEYVRAGGGGVHELARDAIAKLVP